MQAVNTFIAKVEDTVPESHRIPLLDVALQSTSTRWWKNHCTTLSQWSCVTQALKARFKEDEGPRSGHRYQWTSDPRAHLKSCEEQWRGLGYPQELWVHQFIHSLDTIPQAWYLEEERKMGTGSWREVIDKFFRCFSLEGETELVTRALQAIKGVLFLRDPELDGGTFAPRPEVKRELSCQQIDDDPKDDNLEDFRYLYFEEKEGELNINEESTTKGVHL